MNQLQQRVWQELIVQPGRPPALTPKRIAQLGEILAQDQDFWADLLVRHNLSEKSLAELEPAVREHAIGNFWGMLMQAFLQK